MTTNADEMRASAIDRVATERHRLTSLTMSADRARADLYRAVHAATLAGVPTMVVADAAGWKTKKAVYDACRSVDGDGR